MTNLGIWSSASLRSWGGTSRSSRMASSARLAARWIGAPCSKSSILRSTWLRSASSATNHPIPRRCRRALERARDPYQQSINTLLSDLRLKGRATCSRIGRRKRRRGRDRRGATERSLRRSGPHFTAEGWTIRAFVTDALSVRATTRAGAPIVELGRRGRFLRALLRGDGAPVYRLEVTRATRRLV